MERYIKIEDIGKVCDTNTDHDVEQYTAEEIAASAMKSGKVMTVNKVEAEEMLTLMDLYFFDHIRVDEDIDNISWLGAMALLHRKLETFLDGKGRK